jgi:hypothetical protein
MMNIRYRVDLSEMEREGRAWGRDRQDLHRHVVRKDGVTYLRHSQICKDYVAGMLRSQGVDVTPALRDDDNPSTERGGGKGRARGT